MEKVKFICLAVLLALYSCTQKQEAAVENANEVPYYNSPDFTPLWTADPKVIDTLHHIRDFSFTDQYGQAVTQDTFKGKIYLTDFFFTSCTSICPKLTGNMKQVYEKFKGNPNVMFLSHSVSPRIDSTERLHAYAQDRHIEGRQWRFVHGNITDIYDIARRSYYVEEYLGLNKDSTEFLHTEKFILIDGRGHIRGIYNGTVGTELSRIVEDINGLLKERS